MKMEYLKISIKECGRLLHKEMKMDTLAAASKMICIRIKLIKMEIVFAGIFLLSILFLSSCQGNLDSWIGDYYRTHITTGKNKIEIRNDKLLSSGEMPKEDNRMCVIDLKDITPFEWDTVYVVTGYEEDFEIERFIGYKRHSLLPSSFCRKTLFSKGNRIIYMYLQEEEFFDSVISSPQISEGMKTYNKYSKDDARFQVTVKNHEYHLEHLSSEK